MRSPAGRKTVTLLMTVPAHLQAEVRAIVDPARVESASPRALSELDKDLLRLSVEALYRAAAAGEGERAQACARFLEAVIFDGRSSPFDLEQLRRLDARLLQHAVTVLQLGRGLDGVALAQQCDKQSNIGGCVERGPA
jgi:hypothetical protein